MTQTTMPLRLLRPDLDEIQTLREVERAAIETALARLNGNITTASELLGVSRSTLYRKVIGHELAGKLLEFRKKEGDCGLVHE